MSGYFEREQTKDVEVFTPTTDAVSGWGKLVRGPAMTSLMARTIEQVLSTQVTDNDGFVPAKTTFDLHSPLPLVPVETRATVLRDGRRLKLIDAELVHDGRVYARARSLWLKRDAGVDVSDNQPWSANRQFTTPGPGPWDLTDDGRIYWSALEDDRKESQEEARRRWSDQGTTHQNGRRKAVWQFPVPTVIGEALTGFEVAANVCDVATLATGWGPEGLDFINADATLSLVRYPTSTEVGVAAIDRIEQDGIAIGTAALNDADGQFATAQVTKIAQPGGRIQFPDPAKDESNKLKPLLG